jgi:hypothetical protein
MDRAGARIRSATIHGRSTARSATIHGRSVGCVDPGRSTDPGLTARYNLRLTDPAAYCGTVPKTISVQVDDETFVRIDHALEVAGARDGVGRVAKSVFLRRLIQRGLDDPRPLFDQGFIEGYRAGFAATMRTFQDSIGKMLADPSAILGLRDVGMSSPFDERGGGDS